MKSLELDKKRDLDFLPLALDFVPPGLEFLRRGLESLPHYWKSFPRRDVPRRRRSGKGTLVLGAGVAGTKSRRKGLRVTKGRISQVARSMSCPSGLAVRPARKWRRKPLKSRDQRPEIPASAGVRFPSSARRSSRLRPPPAVRARTSRARSSLEPPLRQDGHGRGSGLKRPSTILPPQSRSRPGCLAERAHWSFGDSPITTAPGDRAGENREPSGCTRANRLRGMAWSGST